MNETIDYVLTREERDALYKRRDLKHKHYLDIVRVLEIKNPHAKGIARKEVESALDHFFESICLDDEALDFENEGGDPSELLKRAREEHKRGLAHIEGLFDLYKKAKERGLL